MRTPLQSMYARLKISPNPETGKWVLLESFIYYIDIKGWKRFIEIPAWFEFDGASIPRIFWVFWHPMQLDTLIAACVHDYIYSKKKFDRERCDEIFNDVMELCEVKTGKRIAYYLWVRIWWILHY